MYWVKQARKQQHIKSIRCRSIEIVHAARFLFGRKHLQARKRSSLSRYCRKTQSVPAIAKLPISPSPKTLFFLLWLAFPLNLVKYDSDLASTWDFESYVMTWVNIDTCRASHDHESDTLVRLCSCSYLQVLRFAQCNSACKSNITRKIPRIQSFQGIRMRSRTCPSYLHSWVRPKPEIKDSAS